MKKLVYWEFECLSFNDITELFTKLHIEASMAYIITNCEGGTFRLAAYGVFPGDAEDWGFEDADCGMFQKDPTFLSLKKKYETMKANGEFKN